MIRVERNLLLYLRSYLYYCLLFLFLYLSFVSTVAFFHFLLEHDLVTIENWLNRNAWQALGVSKILALLILIRFKNLNHADFDSIHELKEKLFQWPSQQVLMFIIYLMIFIVAFIYQFGDGIIEQQSQSAFSFTSFLGPIVFYLCDVYFLNQFSINFNLSKLQYFLSCLVTPILFLSTTLLALPYVDNYYMFIILHFLSLSTFLIVDKTNLMNLLCYSFLVIGPLSTVFGIDIVWDNAYSLYVFPQSIPTYSLVTLWLLGLVYCFRRSLFDVHTITQDNNSKELGYGSKN